MLSIHILNDASGTVKVGHYKVLVFVNDSVIWKGSVKNFKRKLGWAKLLEEVVKEYKKEDPADQLAKDILSYENSKLQR